MTSPRPYGGAYSSPSFADTPIYDRLVAERGTPQIAPIRVPAAYDSLGYQPAPAPQPALPALPALPSGPSQPQPQPAFQQPQQQGYGGYQAAPVRQQFPAGGPPGPAPHFPQQANTPRPYQAQAPQAPQAAAPQQMRPAAPRPMPPRPMPGAYQGQGQSQAPGQHPYPAQAQPQPPAAAQQQPYASPGYWQEQGAGH
ncbi:DUF6643 family protein [Streptomyces sp. NBC_01803]|uniref:DUF6643 family protein n=1 Tax=Streptomyces sp. NBC_01803 TaxID=2975946 RepID=UPI002DD8AB33|nr:DUF6643 family protein [Streptomyces sp. NBC_01803]WSA47226.1 hypothetical protein OIE51_25415 [Streptomyces sp. NBC_01803]